MKPITTPLQRVCLHLRCIAARPRQWRFYVSGILREIPNLTHHHPC